MPGRELDGIHQAMEYLPWGNRVQEGDLDAAPITAAGKHVIIIGGGDTGADCLGTAHRQGAASVTQLEILPRPPDSRAPANPWPQWSLIYRTSSAHEEGGERLFSVNTECFLDDGTGRVARSACTRSTWSTGASRGSRTPTSSSRPSSCCWPWASSARRRVLARPAGCGARRAGQRRSREDFMTSVPGVFAAGDMGRGQSLIVWAIAEGRACAAGVDRWLMGETSLPRRSCPPPGRSRERRGDRRATQAPCGDRRLARHAASRPPAAPPGGRACSSWGSLAWLPYRQPAAP